MLHFQEIFIKNLRYFRKKRGYTQLAFSEVINLSPNYLNAIERGKNFPSPDVIQKIIDTLEILPFELFLEDSSTTEEKINHKEKQAYVKKICDIKAEIDILFEKYQQVE